MHIMFALADHEKEKLKRDPRVAFEAFRTGDGNLTLWRVIAVRLNVLADVVKNGDPEWLELSRNAAIAMRDCRQHAEAGNAWTFTGPQYTAIRLALNAADDAQDQMTRVELYHAYNAACAGSKACTKRGVIFMDTFGALATGATA